MSKWIQVGHDFGNRCAVLTLSYCEAQADAVQGWMAEKEPEEIEPLLLDMIGRLRPELLGGWVLGFNFDFGTLSWEIWYAHASLPKCGRGDVPARRPLVEPEYEPRHMVVMTAEK